MALKSDTDEPQIIVIDANGPGEVTAADIITTESVEILNGDLHIATLDEDSRLYIEMVVERGRGYVSSVKNKKEDQPIGTIPNNIRHIFHYTRYCGELMQYAVNFDGSNRCTRQRG